MCMYTIHYTGKPPSPTTRRLAPASSTYRFLRPLHLIHKNQIEVPCTMTSVPSLSTATVVTRDNLALEVFITNFDAVRKAVTPHVDWLIKKLPAKLAIPKESYDQLRPLHSPLLGPSQKAVVLLVLTQLSVAADYHCLRHFVRVLKRCPSLEALQTS